MARKRRNQNKRRKNGSANSRRPRQQRTQRARGSAHETLSNAICGMVDPFCSHALSAKVPSEGSYRTVSANISDYYSRSASQDATTGDYYISERRLVGVESCIGVGTMDNSVVTSVSTSDSSWQSSLSDAVRYRVVCAAIRITYTGAPLGAQGYVRISKVSSANTGTTSEFPSSLSSLTGLYWDYTPSQLRKGVTVILHPVDPAYKRFFDMDNATVPMFYEAVDIKAVGLASTATISIETRQTIEFIPAPASTSSLVATPNHKSHSIIDNTLSKVSDTLHIHNGTLSSMASWVKDHVGGALNGLFSAGLQKVGGYVTEALSDVSVSGILEEAGMGLMALL